MRAHLTPLATLLLAPLLLVACSADDGPARVEGTRAAPPAGTRTAPASYAFPRRDEPYDQVLAEARQTGRPVLLFFWTSW